MRRVSYFVFSFFLIYFIYKFATLTPRPPLPQEQRIAIKRNLNQETCSKTSLLTLNPSCSKNAVPVNIFLTSSNLTSPTQTLKELRYKNFKVQKETTKKEVNILGTALAPFSGTQTSFNLEDRLRVQAFSEVDSEVYSDFTGMLKELYSQKVSREIRPSNVPCTVFKEGIHCKRGPLFKTYFLPLRLLEEFKLTELYYAFSLIPISEPSSKDLELFFELFFNKELAYTYVLQTESEFFTTLDLETFGIFSFFHSNLKSPSFFVLLVSSLASFFLSGPLEKKQVPEPQNKKDFSKNKPKTGKKPQRPEPFPFVEQHFLKDNSNVDLPLCIGCPETQKFQKIRPKLKHKGPSALANRGLAQEERTLILFLEHSVLEHLTPSLVTDYLRKNPGFSCIEIFLKKNIHKEEESFAGKHYFLHFLLKPVKASNQASEFEQLYLDFPSMIEEPVVDQSLKACLTQAQGLPAPNLEVPFPISCKENRPKSESKPKKPTTEAHNFIKEKKRVDERITKTATTDKKKYPPLFKEKEAEEEKRGPIHDESKELSSFKKKFLNKRGGRYQNPYFWNQLFREKLTQEEKISELLGLFYSSEQLAPLPELTPSLQDRFLSGTLQDQQDVLREMDFPGRNILAIYHLLFNEVLSCFQTLRNELRERFKERPKEKKLEGEDLDTAISYISLDSKQEIAKSYRRLVFK